MNLYFILIDKHNYLIYPMENIYKNDIKEGNKIITNLSDLFNSPLRQTAISQIIFQHTYPTFFKRESHSLISLVSFYISGKITENVIKLNILLEKSNYKFPKEKAIFIESRILEFLSFNFDIIPVHMYIQSICKDLDIPSENKLKKINEIHSDNRVNYINYINGIYDPELVAVSSLSDDEIDIFEVMYCKQIDKNQIKEIRKLIFKE